MQDNHVICYESIKLKKHEKNYATHDPKLPTIVHALKMWRHYLMVRRFELRTDHCGLKYLFDQPTLNARQAIWLEFLCDFDFEIKHINGKENKVACHMPQFCKIILSYLILFQYIMLNFMLSCN